MKLSNLEISSLVRMTQPSAGENGATDIEFDGTKGAVISSQLYALAFYNLMNGYVAGKDGGSSVTGFVFTTYDSSNVVMTESAPVKVDMVMDELGTKLVAKAETTAPDTSADAYFTKMTVSFVSNEEGVDKEFLIMETTAPALTKFAQAIGSTGKKGIMVEGGMDTKFSTTFTLSWK